MPDSAPAQHPAKFPPLWRNPSFTLMWTSTAASGFGDRMIMLAALALLGGLAKDADSSGIQASTQFFFFLPYLIFNLFGGWLADRLPRKWVLLGCDESRGLILTGAFLALIALTGEAALDPSQRWMPWLMLAGIGTFAAIFNPTRNAIIPQIVPNRQLQSGNAVILVINVIASMIGLVVGSWFIISPDSIASVRTGILYGAAFYVVSGFFFAFMRPHDVIRTQGTAKRTLAQTVRYAWSHKRIMTLIGVDILVWGSAALVSTGILGVLKVHYELADKPLQDAFAVMSATMGVGMLAGAGVVIVLGTLRENSILLTLGLIFAGICTLVFATVPFLPLTYAAAFGVGLFGNIAIIGALTMLQNITPNFIRGRIMGLNSVITTVFSIVIYGTIWRLPDTDRLILIAMAVCGPLLIVCGSIALIRHLRSGPMPNRGANIFWRLTRLFCFSWHSLNARGKHHIPHTGPVVIVANHTTAMDPFLIQASSNRMVRWLMLTSYRMKIGNPLWNAIDPICIEHNLASDERSSAMRQVRQIVGELKKGHIVGMFPEGALQYDSRELAAFEDGAAVVARLAGAQIVPCWVDGTVVSQSMLKHVLKPTHSSITFGPPFTPTKDQSPEAITAELRRRILALGEQESARRAADDA